METWRQISWTNWHRITFTDFNSTWIQLSQNCSRGTLDKNTLQSAFPNQKNIPVRTTKTERPMFHPTNSGMLPFSLSCGSPWKAGDGTAASWEGDMEHKPPHTGPWVTDGCRSTSLSSTPSSRPDPLKSKPFLGTHLDCGCRLWTALCFFFFFPKLRKRNEKFSLQF